MCIRAPSRSLLPTGRVNEEGFELLPVACYENNEALLEVYRTLDFAVYPGISAREAREAMEAEQ